MLSKGATALQLIFLDISKMGLPTGIKLEYLITSTILPLLL